MIVWLFAPILILPLALIIYILAAGPQLPAETDAVIDQVMNGQLPEFITGKSGYASSGDVDIWYESINGDGPQKQTILLLMGQGGDALGWPPAFIRALVAAGYHVVRYDHRGTGMSDWVENWSRKNPYSLADMAADAVAVLDALEVPEAHLCGLSMGGMIAQEVAAHYPERVASLTLMMTSGYIGDPELPGLSSRYFLGFLLKGLPLLKYRLRGGERNLIKERIAKQIAAPGYTGLDIKESAEVVLYDLRKRKGINLRAVLQHHMAITVSGSRYEKLATLKAPTLVIHGTADRLIPVEHGKKLVEVIPGARGLWLDGVGHLFPVPDMDALVKNIELHLEKVSDA